jgi:mono/diheme cytochrome c family protein
MNSRQCILVLLAAVGATPLSSSAPQDAKPVDYDREIQPIFARHCYQCHGEKKPRGGLRLDRRGNLLKGGDSGEPAVLPGKSADSHLINLVTGGVKDKIMPPKSTGDKLSAKEIVLLRAWIDQGAKFSAAGATDEGKSLNTKHWSLQPVAPVVPPNLKDPWVVNSVDAFILAELQKHKLQPSPSADRVTLIRRLYLDMHGLPPTPEQVRRFVNDRHPKAYENLVEEVLASPRYGERWAQHWLDIVRYAETHGFETNTPRDNAWPYRDYVIAAFNQDKPYDQFIVEQLAGDVVGVDAATGFLVAGPQDQVKSPDPVLTGQQRQDELNEMINATGSTFLGLTVSCARCHNHKFDPISQKDYYSLQAAFAGVQYGDRPWRRRSDKQSPDELAQLQRQLRLVQEKLDNLAPLAQSGYRRDAVNSQRNIERIQPTPARYIRFTVLASNSAEPCLDELEVWSQPTTSAPARNVALASAGAKATSSGNYSGNPFHKLEHIHDGRYGNEWSWISNENGKGWVQLTLPAPVVIDRIVWGRDRNRKYQDRTPTRYKIEVAALPNRWQLVACSDDRTRVPGVAVAGQERKDLTREQIEEARRLAKEYQDLTARMQSLARSPQVYAGTFAQPGPTRRLYRGDPMAPREAVPPAIPAVFGSIPVTATTPEQQRRLALARWIASKDNPLTARVMVNRLWHYHFGTGIVTTPSDFGKNGGRPSHPELLDWLARQFMDNGWSIKQMHRLILLANTYRQASVPHADGIKVDAQDRVFWRFPQRRLEAEAIHDSILAVSGALNLQMGGPGFNVFEPNNNYVRVYKPKETFGPAEWRRMVYMHKVRMEPDGIFGAFDCPDAGQAAPRRTRSTTPLQALNLFNSNFVQQQAGILAQRVHGEVGDDPHKQVRRVFELALGRMPNAREEAACVPVVQQHGLRTLCRVVFNMNEFLFLP